MVWHTLLKKCLLQLLCQNPSPRLMGSVLGISPRLNFGPAAGRGVQQTPNCNKSTASSMEQALQSPTCFEAGRGQYPQEQQFVMVVSDVQQRPGGSAPPRWVWGSLGARVVPDLLGRSGMVVPLETASSAVPGCIPTARGVIRNPSTSGKGES